MSVDAPWPWEEDTSSVEVPDPREGLWAATYDDTAQTVTETAPGGAPVTRAYTPAEAASRAAQIYAAQIAAHLAEARDALTGEMATLTGELTNAQGQVAEVTQGLTAAQAAADAAAQAATGPVPLARLTAGDTPTDPDALAALLTQARTAGVLAAQGLVIAGDPTNKVGAAMIADGAVTAPKIHATSDLWAALLTVAGDATIGGDLIANGAIAADKLQVNAAMAASVSAMIATFQEAFIGSLRAQMIRADSFAGYRIEGAEIVSPSDTGSIRLADNSLTIARGDGSDGDQITAQLGGTEADHLALTPLGQQDPTVYLDGRSGDGALAGNLSVGSLTVDGDPLAETLSSLPRGVIAWTSGSGNAMPDVGNTPYGVCRLRVGITAWRRYAWSADLTFQGTPGDVIQFSLRHSTSEGGATVGHQEIRTWRIEVPPLGVGATHLRHLFRYPWGHSDYSLLLTMQNLTTSTRPVRLWSDTMSDRSQSVFWVEDLGLAELGAAEWTGGGGTPYTGSIAPAAPAPTKRTYTRRYNAIGIRSWRGSSIRTDTLQHGTWGGQRGISQILFTGNARVDLTGATVKSARVRLRCTHTGLYAGMTAFISVGTQQTLQGAPAGAPAGAQSGWRKGEAKFVALSGWTPASQSVWLGIGAGAGSGHYGKFSSALADCVLEVTYEK